MSEIRVFTDKDSVFIFTDLEPDDIAFLIISLIKFGRLKDGNVPKIYIVVGEGNIPQSKIPKVKEILDSMAHDVPLRQEFLDKIKILGGSSSKEENSFAHTFYNKNFFTDCDIFLVTYPHLHIYGGPVKSIPSNAGSFKSAFVAFI
jgi:hypothetical protein